MVFDSKKFFCVACEYNERITAQLTNRLRGMDHELLLASRRKCLKMWNQSTICKFTSREPTPTQQELAALIDTMITRFLPCFFRLATSTSDDRATLDEIRQSWLSILDSNLPGEKNV